jgi:hypothetical protein
VTSNPVNSGELIPLNHRVRVSVLFAFDPKLYFFLPSSPN